jgi:hypothetical protein
MAELNSYHEKMLGVPDGISYGQNERVDELNTRTQSRQFPSQILKPNFDFRPVPTKYSHFPILDRRTPVTVPYRNYSDYSVNSVFNPGNARAPIDAFIQNIDTETILRNQCFALQRKDNNSVYVPSSQSDLYNVPLAVGRQEMQTHHDLFIKPTFDSTVHPNIRNAPTVGADTFFNNTRTQLRNTG